VDIRIFVQLSVCDWFDPADGDLVAQLEVVSIPTGQTVLPSWISLLTFSTEFWTVKQVQNVHAKHYAWSMSKLLWNSSIPIFRLYIQIVINCEKSSKQDAPVSAKEAAR
jgi:hypothetical protein